MYHVSAQGVDDRIMYVIIIIIKITIILNRFIGGGVGGEKDG